MEANELRIKNLVNYDEDNTVFEVIEISESGIKVKDSEEETWIELDQFSGIPLTEEWLLKFGFKKQDDGWFYPNNNFRNQLRICLPDGGEWWNYSLGYNDFPKRKEDEQPVQEWLVIKLFKHVHQLQNLYYALTGEELTIKELATSNKYLK